MPVVGLLGPRCSASAATSSVNFCFSFTTRSRPLCSHSRWRLSLDVVTWSAATKIGLQHRPNARYPAPLWPCSTRKDHKHTRPLSWKGRYLTCGACVRGGICARSDLEPAADHAYLDDRPGMMKRPFRLKHLLNFTVYLGPSHTVQE